MKKITKIALTTIITFIVISIVSYIFALLKMEGTLFHFITALIGIGVWKILYSFKWGEKKE